MKSNKFSLSHTVLTSCDMGELIPIGLTEVLPGDRWQHSASVLLRCAPMLAPIMHPVDVRVHHWFVPHRLVWVDFEKFITGGPDGNDASAFPVINSPAVGGFPVGSLGDYLGVPTGVANLPISALPFRGYAMIFNEWYRDQDLVTPLVLSTASGLDATTNLLLQNIAWEKDYFTSARPWEQKGPSVTVPIGTTAPVVRITNAPFVDLYNSNTQVKATAAADVVVSAVAGIMAAPAAQSVSIDPRGGLLADLTGASAVTVNALRQALAVQRYEENAARYGSRYPEYLQRLGVRSSDARLQRPEYLGGGRQRLQFSEVLQTAEGTDPVASLKGHGIAALRSNRYRRFFEEHGYVHTFLSVRPKTIYANGLFRHWNRRTKYDFWQPELQHIGQQPVLNKEVYSAHASPDVTFGYQDRYDEYRRSESRVSGEFRSTLDFWHMARIFASAPALNSTFVTSVPTERGFAIPSEDVLQLHIRHNIQSRRLLTRVGTSFIF